jgi:hypothetical protein
VVWLVPEGVVHDRMNSRLQEGAVSALVIVGFTGENVEPIEDLAAPLGRLHAHVGTVTPRALQSLICGPVMGSPD